MEKIEIWEPRYHDNTVLIATYKVKPGENHIVFTRARHLAGMEFTVNSEIILKCPTQTNGKIPCFVVPFEKLQRVS